MSIKLGVIGGGVMCEAIISRLLAQGVYAGTEIIISEPTNQRRDFLQQQYGVQVTGDNHLAARADVLLLAIKPQVFDRVVEGLEKSNPTQLVISILAGVSIARLETAFGDRAIVRVMPNTPATVGAGMTAIAAGSTVSSTQLELATQIFQAVGEVVTVAWLRHPLQISPPRHRRR